MKRNRSVAPMVVVALAVVAPFSSGHAQAWRADADDAAGALVPGLVASSATLLTGLDGYFAKHVRSKRVPLDAQSRVAALSDVGGIRGSTLLAGALVIAGYAGHDRRVARLGEHVFLGTAISYGITTTLKGLVGRQRPNASESSRSFRPMRGFVDRNFRSFPSGHASSAFAVATVLATGVQGPSLTERRLIGGVAYTMAALVGISRVSLNEHWASDVLSGATIGVVAGTWVTQRARRSGAFRATAGGSGVPVPIAQLRF